jgi:hypothetical protein
MQFGTRWCLRAAVNYEALRMTGMFFFFKSAELYNTTKIRVLEYHE